MKRILPVATLIALFSIKTSGQSILGDSNVCEGDSTILLCNSCGLPPTNTSSPWSSSNPSIASITANGMVIGNSPGTATITYTNIVGSTVTASFTVGAIPTLVNNGSITYFCQENINQSIGFSSYPSSANNSIKWYDSNLSPIIPNPSAITVDCNIPQNDTNYISQVSPLGCEGPKSAVVTIVVATPSAPLTQNLIYCVGDNAPSLTAQFDPGNQLQWFKSSSPSTVTTNITPSTASPGQETWFVRQMKLIPINQVCIGPKSSLTVKVDTSTFTDAGQNQSVCAGSNVVLNAKVPCNAHSFEWSDSIVDGVSFLVDTTKSFFFRNLFKTFFKR